MGYIGIWSSHMNGIPSTSLAHPGGHDPTIS